MTPTHTPLSVDSSDASLRRLARALLADAGAADDVTQQSWAELLCRVEPPQRPQAFLRTVVRRRAANRQRDDARRTWHERVAPGPVHPPGPLEALLASEQQRQLARALLRRSNAERALLHERFVLGLSTLEIAHRGSRPVNTVRSQLRRTIAHLRRDLDPPNERGIPSVVPWFAAVSSARWIRPPGRPILTVAWAHWIVAAMVLCGAVMVTVWARHDTQASHVSAGSITQLTAASPLGPLPTPKRATRSRLTQVHPTSTASQPSAPDQESVARWNVSCIDENGKPVPNAEVSWFAVRSDASPRRYELVGSGACDERGQGQLVLEGDAEWDVYVFGVDESRAFGLTRCRKTRGEDVTMTLCPAAPLEGKVVVPAGFDASSLDVTVISIATLSSPGNAQALPTVHGMLSRSADWPGLDTALPQWFDAKTDARGHFSFPCLPKNARITLRTTAPALSEGQWASVTDPHRSRVQIDLFDESVITGRIIGRTDLTLALTAHMLDTPKGFGTLSSFDAEVDADGLFRLGSLAATTYALALCDDRGHHVATPRVVTLAVGERLEAVEFFVSAPIRVSGRALDEQGRPLVGVRITAQIPVLAPGMDSRWPIAAAVTDEGGRYSLLLPSGSIQLHAQLGDVIGTRPLRLEPDRAEVTNADITLRPR